MPEKVFVQHFAAGDKIISSGELGKNAYFIEKGCVQVFFEQPLEMTLIAVLGPGEIFGEMSLIDDAPRSATVVAKKDTEVIVIERSRFTEPLFSDKPIEHLLLRVLLERFRESQNQMSNVQINARDHSIALNQIRNLAFKRINEEKNLRQAIELEELELHYQPIINLRTGEIGGFEALIRWKKEGKYILPNDFIPLAEETGIILEMGRWILERGLSDQREINNFYQKYFPEKKLPFMSLNVSSLQLSNIAETRAIGDIIKRNTTNPNNVKLEITESLMINNPNLAGKALNKLKKIGVSLTIDDFGTGYSSLSYLHRFPFDTLKIDQAFVKNMNRTKSAFRIINCIVQLAKALDLSIVAEGVENIEQLKKLKGLNCDYGQGFFMSKPQPLKKLMDLLETDPKWLS